MQGISRIFVHLVLSMWGMLAIAPFILIVANSFKSRAEIFNDPLALPTDESFSLSGYRRIFEDQEFIGFILNSVTVTTASLFIIIFAGAMAAYGLTESRCKAGKALWWFLIVGTMIPLRLGTVGLINIMAPLDLLNSLPGLILVYSAQGLPLSILIFSEVFIGFSKELKDSAKIDGLNNLQVLFYVVLPVVRPTAATIAVFSMVPIWNDLWFPLVLASAPESTTITLGVQKFVGQYSIDWPSVLAALSVAICPALLIYMTIARNFVNSLSSGGIKG